MSKTAEKEMTEKDDDLIEKEAETAEESLRALNNLRAMPAIEYSISRGFSKTKKLSEADQKLISSTIEVESGHTSTIKKVFDTNHAEVKKILEAETKLKNYIESRSITYYAARGVRLLRVTPNEKKVNDYFESEFFEGEDDYNDLTDVAKQQYIFNRLRTEGELEFYKQVEEYNAELQSVVSEFNQFHYSDVLEYQKQKLKSKFNPDDYPSQITVNVTMRQVSITPDNFNQSFSPELKERAWKQMVSDLEVVKAGIIDNLVTSLQNRTERIIDRMTGKSGDGKRKMFKNVLINNMHDDLNFFHAAIKENDLSTPQLDDVMDRIQRLLTTVNPASCRGETKSAEDARTSLSESCTKIFNRLNKCLVNKPARKLDLSKFEEKNGN